jgi:hypothetical protein
MLQLDPGRNDVAQLEIETWARARRREEDCWDKYDDEELEKKGDQATFPPPPSFPPANLFLPLASNPSAPA